MKIQTFALAILLGAAAATAVGPAVAQGRSGFYGGISLPETNPGAGLSLGQAATRGLRAPGVDETTTQQVFGGYRWTNDLAVEAAFARSESYALRPFSAGVPSGVGLALGKRADPASAAYNVDVFGSYTVLRSFALYGRVGYAQSDLAGAGASTLLATTDPRRLRDGMNYGLGMRYDVTRVLGVNLEYTRFGRFAYDSFGSTLPENDQVRLGVQFRF